MTFFGKKELKALTKDELKVNIRGGRQLTCGIKAQVIIPQVTIVEEVIDFGEVTTLVTSQPYYITIQNKSNIPAILMLDLRIKEDGKDNEGVDCLERVKSLEKNGGDEDDVIKSVDPEKENSDDKEKEEENDELPEHIKDANESGSEEESQSENEEASTTRYYKIRVKQKNFLVSCI